MMVRSPFTTATFRNFLIVALGVAFASSLAPSPARAKKYGCYPAGVFSQFDKGGGCRKGLMAECKQVRAEAVAAGRTTTECSKGRGCSVIFQSCLGCDSDDGVNGGMTSLSAVSYLAP